MFGRKKPENPVGGWSQNPTPALPCETCGCMVQAEKVCEVKRPHFYNGPAYYCSRCKPPYDEISDFSLGLRYYRIVPAQRIQVDEKGKEVK